MSLLKEHLCLFSAAKKKKATRRNHTGKTEWLQAATQGICSGRGSSKRTEYLLDIVGPSCHISLSLHFVWVQIHILQCLFQEHHPATLLPVLLLSLLKPPVCLFIPARQKWGHTNARLIHSRITSLVGVCVCETETETERDWERDKEREQQIKSLVLAEELLGMHWFLLYVTTNDIHDFQL